MITDKKNSLGAHYLGEGKCRFTLWAPFYREAALEIVSPQQRIIPLKKTEEYWEGVVEDLYPGARYFYKLGNTKKRPDPASHYQPEGVHGPSEIIDHNIFPWEDQTWTGIPLDKMIMYELHIGTFTATGTFDAVIQRLDNLYDLGINALEIMPIAQFPGNRNWGYDGTCTFAVQNSYGGPEGFKRLINSCHQYGIAVILDVVYNHFGPEGNYVHDFGPYFTEKYKTPWGKAINYDDAYSGGVRNFFCQNALYWLEYYHIDALRLDAIHGIYDMGSKHILEELAENVENFFHTSGRKHYLIAESDLSDTRIIKKKELGGYGIDAQWCDDFHHSLHTLLTGEKDGYYLDFKGKDCLIKSMSEGFVYSWQYSPYRKKIHGSSSKDLPAHQFVVFTQNHDQVGNRMRGERLSQLISFEALKLAAGALFISPYIPLLFMGEEYAEEAPFLYFISHSDQDLIKAVREGRKREFKTFQWQEEPPDPQSKDTFLKSVLQWEKQKCGKNKIMRDFYAQLIKLRKEIPALLHLSKKNLKIWGMEKNNLLFLCRWYEKSKILSIMNFDHRAVHFTPEFFKGKEKKRIDSSDALYMGPGASMPRTIESKKEFVIQPFCFVLYEIDVQ